MANMVVVALSATLSLGLLVVAADAVRPGYRMKSGMMIWLNRT